MKLKTLGGLALEGVSFGRVKPLLLLAYLALEGPKEKRFLAWLFWQATANPLHSLAKALFRLRQAAPGSVNVDGERAWAQVEMDALEMLSALEHGQLEEGVRLYKGAFLEGVYLPDWPAELEEWLYGTREFLAARVQEALLQLGEKTAAAGEFAQSARYAETACKLPGASGLEPESLERAHLLLVAGDHPYAATVRKEAREFGATLTHSKEQASARLSPNSRPTAGSSNLPIRPSSFVGRGFELKKIAKLLDQETCRLLTLTGTGGSGKTRLALEASYDHLQKESFRDSVTFVPLDSLSSPHAIPSSIASVLGVSLTGSAEPFDQLSYHLKGRHMLLVLDNFEHLIEGAGVLSELLARCPDLKLLLTSRERLNLMEEWALPLDGLSLPAESAKAPEQALAAEAVQLFVQRAKQANLDFELDKANVQDVTSICRLVGGLPLALEIAAVWVRIMPCREIALEIAGNLDFLSAGARNVVDRHRSLRATFEHSWKLLSVQEQNILKGLSVFRGGFTREAASEVGGASISVLGSLVDKSLLHLTPRGRFDRHPLLCQYIQEKLAEHPEERTQAQAKHLRYYFVLAEEAERHLVGTEQATWLERLEVEHDNLRAALQWVEGSGQAELGLRLAGALGWFWQIHGHLSEGREHLAKVLKGTNRQSAARAKALHSAGLLAHWQADNASARSLFEESLAIFQKLRDKRGIASSLNSLGWVTGVQGDYTSARSLFEESLASYRELGDEWSIACLLHSLAWVARVQNDYASARALFRESLAIMRGLGDKLSVANLLSNLGIVAHIEGDYSLAHRLLEESLAIMRELGNKWGIAGLLGNLGIVAHELGDYARARALHEESLIVARELGNNWGIANALEEFASLAMVAGDAERAARLWGAAKALRETIRAPLPPDERSRYERDLAAARAQLGEAEFMAAWTEGQALSLDEALAYVHGQKSGLRSPVV